MSRIGTFRFSPELRVRTYEYYLKDEKPLKLKSYFFSEDVDLGDTRLIPALLLTNKQVHYEALAVRQKLTSILVIASEKYYLQIESRAGPLTLHSSVALGIRNNIAGYGNVILAVDNLG